jgi:isopenicillin N synthase-like dioxygenase
VVNVADMFQRWSNDTLRSAKHRVRATHLDKERWSMPYFVDPGRDVIIKNLTDQPAKYEPIGGYEYLKWRLAQMYSPDTDNYEEKEELKKDEHLTQHLY